MNYELQAAIDSRNDGMRRADEHAVATIDGWHEMVDNMMSFFLLHQRKPFLAEEFVKYCAGKIPPPPDGRAFGPVFARAQRAGKIYKNGYALALSSNLSPKVLWVKA